MAKGEKQDSGSRIQDLVDARQIGEDLVAMSRLEGDEESGILDSRHQIPDTRHSILNPNP